VEEIRLALDFTATIFARSGAANPRDALDENKPRAPASRPGKPPRRTPRGRRRHL